MWRWKKSVNRCWERGMVYRKEDTPVLLFLVPSSCWSQGCEGRFLFVSDCSFSETYPLIKLFPPPFLLGFPHHKAHIANFIPDTCKYKWFALPFYGPALVFCQTVLWWTTTVCVGCRTIERTHHLPAWTFRGRNAAGSRKQDLRFFSLFSPASLTLTCCKVK